MTGGGRLFDIKLSTTGHRYLIIGIAVYLLELLIIIAAQHFGAGSVTAVGISFWVGLLASFGLQKLVTFGDKRLHHHIVLPQLIATTLLALFNFGFTLFLTWLLASILPAVVCRTLALGLTVLWNYYFYKSHIFKVKPGSSVSMTGQIKLMLNHLYQQISVRLRSITIYGGSLIVAVWTLIRHFSNGINYDVIGQLSLTDQWAYGLIHGAQLGSTNYLLKMPIYYLMNGFEIIGPRIRLMLLILIFNIITFLLLLIIMEKILNLYQIRHRSWLYLGMLWLATISGRVFWLDYPNSRNLETAGGLFFLYLILSFWQDPKAKRGLIAVLTGSIVFFADPLQFFMIGLPLILYFGAKLVIERQKSYWRQVTAVWSIIVGAYLLSKLYFDLARVLLPVSFLKVPAHIPAATFTNFMASLKNIVTETLKIFYANFTNAPYSLTTVSRLLNFIVMSVFVFLVVVILRKKPPSLLPKNLLITMIILMYGVYVVSGQALQTNTSRYLIMVPLIALLGMAVWGEQGFSKHKITIQLSWFGIILVNSAALIGALYMSYPSRYAKEAYTYQIQNYMRQNNYRYAVTSREFALPTNYYADRQAYILPVICGPDHQLHATHLFFDSSVYQKLETSDSTVPLLLPGSQLRQGETCSKADIIRQFGQPLRQEAIPGLGEALLYQTANLNLK